MNLCFKVEKSTDINSIYFKAVLKSALIFKIRGTAKLLFKNWQTHAQQLYPDYLYQADEDNLINDLTSAFAKGMELVWRNENQPKRQSEEWSVCIVLDAVSSKLNTSWSQEYIYKQSKEYKELCFLKTLVQYLKIDDTAIKKLEALYNKLIMKEINAEEQESKNENIICLDHFKNNKKPQSIFKKNIVNYFESIFFEKHFLIFGEILKNKFTFVLTDFFNSDEIIQLIESVKRPS
ncbi:hypothetical protein Ldro_1140 [Legionella drozanskii LLAP-1]|uniref:Uncharacterized protein n=1 Tax=Legionella drozanskii LLAP-1 TaxID=1212489 RepID=A0A0W0SW25_9GAMM|nr:hypothetical protein Ldro_1140 [Legionella drozanskii LLAP-1]PJE10445.1 MAG: hypothetical protein CK430_10205 [Legionella sp.]